MCSIMSKDSSRIWWKNSESTLKLLCFLNESRNPNHRFWLLRIIENLGNRKIITIINKKVWIQYIEKLEWIKP